MRKLLFLAAGMAILAVASVPTGLSAQDCREHCLHCDESSGAPEWYESSGFANSNGWKGACSDDFCGNCGIEAVRNVSVVTEAILEAVRQTRPSEMRRVVSEYGQYLLIQPDRQLLVVKGLGCSPDDLGAVVPLSSKKSDALLEAGVDDLASFIADRDRAGAALPERP